MTAQPSCHPASSYPALRVFCVLAKDDALGGRAAAATRRARRERSEGSQSYSKEILRFAQNDRLSGYFSFRSLADRKTDKRMLCISSAYPLQCVQKAAYFLAVVLL